MFHQVNILCVSIALFFCTLSSAAARSECVKKRVGSTVNLTSAHLARLSGVIKTDSIGMYMDSENGAHIRLVKEYGISDVPQSVLRANLAKNPDRLALYRAISSDEKSEPLPHDEKKCPGEIFPAGTIGFSINQALEKIEAQIFHLPHTPDVEKLTILLKHHLKEIIHKYTKSEGQQAILAMGERVFSTPQVRFILKKACDKRDLGPSGRLFSHVALCLASDIMPLYIPLTQRVAPHILLSKQDTLAFIRSLCNAMEGDQSGIDCLLEDKESFLSLICATLDEVRENNGYFQDLITLMVCDITINAKTEDTAVESHSFHKPVDLDESVDVRKSIEGLSLEGKKVFLTSIGADGNTLLHAYVEHGKEEAVTFLLKQGVPELLHCQDAQGNTPLHCAVNGGSVSLVRLLVESIAGNYGNLFPVNKRGETPLHCAIKRAEKDPEKVLSIATLLLELCGSPCLSYSDIQGNTLLHGAVRSSCESMVILLLHHGAHKLLACKNTQGLTPCKLARSLARSSTHKGVLTKIAAMLEKESEACEKEKKALAEREQEEATLRAKKAIRDEKRQHNKMAKQAQQEAEEKRKKEEEEKAQTLRLKREQYERERAEKKQQEHAAKKAVLAAKKRVQQDAKIQAEQEQKAEAEQQLRIRLEQERQQEVEDAAVKKARKKEEKKKEDERKVALHAAAQKALEEQQKQTAEQTRSKAEQEEAVKKAEVEKQVQEREEKRKEQEPVSSIPKSRQEVQRDARQLIDELKCAVQAKTLEHFKVRIKRFKDEITSGLQRDIWLSAFNDYYYTYGVWLPSFAADWYSRTYDTEDKKHTAIMLNDLLDLGLSPHVYDDNGSVFSILSVFSHLSIASHGELKQYLSMVIGPRA